MTQKLWQQKLELHYSLDVIDIVQFGSSVINLTSPNDIDIAVIFKKISLNDQLVEAQKIKRQLSDISKLPIHIKTYDMYSLFDPGNFAKENILVYGRSLLHSNYFAENLGLLPKIQITYSLVDKEKKDKVRFHYMLKGKKGYIGLLGKTGGILLSPATIEIFPENELEYIEHISKFTKEYKISKIVKIL